MIGRFLIFFIVTTISINSIYAQFSINGIEFSDSAFSKKEKISFFAMGHIYGYPNNQIYTSSSLIENIDVLKKREHDFIMLLGDNYRKFNEINIKPFEKLFLSEFDVPILNSIGNHDIFTDNLLNRNYEGYKNRYNNFTFYKFNLKNTLFIVLDSELHLNSGKTDATISGEQLKFLKECLDISELKMSGVKSIIIFIHKEINKWPSNNYYLEIESLFHSIVNREIDLKVISGDMGNYVDDLYYQEDSKGVQFIHTHIEDKPSDKVLYFEVSNDSVIVKPISLYNLPLKDIKDYKYTPYLLRKLKRLISHKYFGELLLLMFFVPITGYSLFQYFKRRN